MHKQLKSEGYSIKINTEVKDLGVGTALGRTRPRRTKMNRYKRAQTRIKRIAILVRYKRAARKLYCTGAWPQKYHGQASTGLNKSELQAARKEMVQCSGAPKGCCTTTCIATHYSINKDPIVKARVEQIKEWVKLTKELTEDERAEMNKQYYKVYGTMYNQTTEERRVSNKAPMTGIIKTMLDIGWEPYSPTKWINGEEEIELSLIHI